MIDVSYDEVFPISINRRVEQTTLSFEVPIYISVPANVRNEIISQIKVLLSSMDEATEANYFDTIELDVKIN
jgi:hypothetical protein